MSKNPENMHSQYPARKLQQQMTGYPFVDILAELNLECERCPIKDVNVNLFEILGRARDYKQKAPVVRVDNEREEYALLVPRSHIELPELRIAELGKALEELGSLATKNFPFLRFASQGEQFAVVGEDLGISDHHSNRLVRQALGLSPPSSIQPNSRARLPMDTRMFTASLGMLVESAWEKGENTPIVDIGEGGALLVSSERLWDTIDSVDEHQVAFDSLFHLYGKLAPVDSLNALNIGKE